MNDEDSSDESDDDIVLDQSLAATTTQPQPQSQAQQPTTKHDAQPLQSATTTATKHESQQSKPTIVTIAPPTLKSNKNNTAGNMDTDDTNTATMNQQTADALPPPIPFHAQLKANQKEAKHVPDQTTTANTNTNANNNAKADTNDDEVIRPRVDPKLLKMMNLSDANELGENTFFDLDLDALTEKPWNDKSKGIDITDWFNYGFNEESWRKYCCTQIKMRNVLKKQQIQAQTHVQPQHIYYPRPNATQMMMNTNTSDVIMNVNENRPTLGICFDFQNKGKCLRGGSCRWSHDPLLMSKHENDNKNSNTDGICFEFKNKGSCAYGNKCRWRHNIEMPQPMNVMKVNETQQVPQQPKETTHELQARLQVLLGGNAPNIPSVVSSLLHEDKKTKKSKKKKRKHKKSRKRRQKKSISRSV
eukprot:509414_1